MYEIFEHTADLGLRVRAESLEQLFVDAARGLFSMVVADLETVRATEERQWNLAGEEHDYLLFDWLSELLYTFDTERLLLSRFEVSLDQGRLHATALGESVDPARHALEHEVKAITYHALRVERLADEWLAEVIVDI